jgi:hypothetical protein
MDIHIGVIENNADPLKIGRCQVRIFGLHTEDRDEYPTADLPWAVMLNPFTNVADQGMTFTPENGDYVAVSFFDPEKQKPLILGTFARYIDETPDFDSGFSDPNGVNPDSSYTDESSIPRLARNENISQTIIQDKKDNRTTGVSCVDESWDEPETPYDAEYPNNKVIATKDHIIELDDTDGAERVHIYHKSGSSIEYHTNGDVVELIKSKRYVIVTSDGNVKIGGDYNVHIDGDQNKEIGGDENKEIGGSSTITITGNAEVIATGTVTIQGASIALN